MNRILKNFPESDPVGTEHRDIFYGAYKNSPVSVSDMCFESIYGWQEFFGYRVSRYKNLLIVFYKENNDFVVLPPLLIEGKFTEGGWIKEFEELAAIVKKFSYFPEIYSSRLDRSKFDIIDQRDNYDYVYKASALSELVGQSYQPKRNLIKQFKRNFGYRYQPLDKNNLYCALRFIRKFKPAKTPDAPAGLGGGEYRMIFRLLKKFSSMRVTGGVLFVGKQEVAATIGTIVEDFQYPEGVFPTAIVQTEHALTEFKGSFQMINQLFCERLPKDVVFVNREEDLGLPGLRKAKMSYPHTLLKKSMIILKP
jgi:uncharacterized protein